MAKLKKPASIAANDFKSRKWDEITAEHDFAKSDIPTLCILCHWHLIAEQCIEDMTDENGETIVAYTTDDADIRSLPQVADFKKATDAIRALNKDLGINEKPNHEKKKAKTQKAKVLELVNDGKREVARRAR